MTVTLLFWIRIAIICLIGYSLVKYIIFFLRKRGVGERKQIKRSDIINDLLFTGLAVFLFFHFQNRFGKSFDHVLSDAGRQFTGFRFRDMNTGLISSPMDQHSRLILVNYWATWCGPCRKEMPALDKLKKAFPASDLQVIAVSDEDSSVVQQYLRDKSFGFITGTITLTNPVLESLDQRPVSVLLNRNGEILDMVIGSRGYSFFQRWVNGYLEKAAQ